MILRGPRSIAGAVRDLLGSRGRREYAEWGPLPQRAPAASSWWADNQQWFPEGAPPRPRTNVEILVDGRQTFRAAWKAIEQAKHSVWLADWSMSVDMALVRGEDQASVPPSQGASGSGYRVFDLLTAAASQLDVRVLLWSGSLIFKPRALVTRQELARLHRANPRLRGVTDKHVHFAHCHHQKTIVVDGRIAFVGGLDMTDFDVDRWDTPAHPIRAGLNWHDLCLRLEGEAAADVGHNFIQRWQAVTGEAVQLPQVSGVAGRAGSAAVQIVRTIPPRIYPFARDGEFGIAWAYQQAIRSAHSFIYIENQYLWSPAIVNELIAALKREHDPEFRVVLVLPARPNIGKRDTDVHVDQLRAADQGRGRVHLFSLYTAGEEERRHRKRWTYKPIYVHAKVAIVDDQWYTVGSANLNGRGMESDSEINAQVCDARQARALRLQLWSEHLGLPVETVATLSPAQAIDQLWVPLASHGRHIVDTRGGALRATVVRYETGDMPGDLSLGEIEARVLDG